MTSLAVQLSGNINEWIEINHESWAWRAINWEEDSLVEGDSQSYVTILW